MSNSSNWPDWTLDPLNVELTGEYIGFVAKPFWSNTTMAEVITMLAAFYAKLPNTNCTLNATINDISNSVDAIAVLMGTNSETIQDMWAWTIEDGDPTGIITGCQLVGGAAEYISESSSVVPYGYAAINNAIQPVFIVLSILAAGLLAVRFYARRMATNQILAADWMMLLGYVSAFAMGLTITLLQTHTLDYKSWPWNKTYNDYRIEELWICIIYVTYPFPLLFIKCSWLLFYYHLTAWRYVRWAVIATFVFTLCNTLIAFFTQLFGYLPVDFWNHYLHARQSAINPFTAFMVTGALNMFTDILIWVLPLPLVWRLSLEPKERMMSLATFGVGTIACVASTVRLVYIYDSYILPITVTTTPNSTAGVRLCTILEMYLGIISGCMPSIRALVMRRRVPRSAGLEEIDLQDSKTTTQNTVSKDSKDGTPLSPRSLRFETHGYETIGGMDKSFGSEC